jgi:threonine dehydratase
VVLVTEEEIYRALQAVFYQDRLVAEGASVVGIAALLAGKLDAAAPGPMATILTGRNLDMGLFARIVAGADVDLDGKTVKGASWRMK